MWLTGEDSIRDVIAFPKVKDASCLMMQAPDEVDPKQLEELGLEIEKKEEKEEKRLELYFHKRLMNDTLPLSIGGGIGQSRLCMFYLRKAHIGEIQASIWPEDMRKECEELEIHLI